MSVKVTMLREHRCEAAGEEPFDVVIAGGGISGAAIFSRLSRSGYRVLLLDKGDFGSFTSQQSAMMIWGGLLYLTRLDIPTVYHLSSDRDQLLAKYPHAVHAQYFRYFPLKSGWQLRRLVKSFLDIYRVLGGLRRQPNLVEDHFAEEAFVATQRYRGSLAYEEAMLSLSDTRFVLDLIRSHASPSAIPLNYVSLEQGEYDLARKMWRLQLREQFTGKEITSKAHLVINAAGPHVDQLNQHFSIQSPYKHVFSKGVFLSFARPASHTSPLIFELGQHRDVIMFMPWGPISCWGPTEMAIDELAGAAEPTEEEVEFLMGQASHSLTLPLSRQQIISYRSGVRPLAVARSYHQRRYPLELSRRHLMHSQATPAWISVYGGKFTSALSMAATIEQKVASLIGRAPSTMPASGEVITPPTESTFPGLETNVPTLRYCVDHEYCMTIGDYLRRRTNIAQWLPRNGLGNNLENVPHITQLSAQLPLFSAHHPQHSLAHYIEETQRIFNRLQQRNGAHTP